MAGGKYVKFCKSSVIYSSYQTKNIQIITYAFTNRTIHLPKIFMLNAQKEQICQTFPHNTFLLYTVYHERQKSYAVFAVFACPRNFYLRWRYSGMDLRESMWDPAKDFLRRSACTTCCKTFLPRNFCG